MEGLTILDKAMTVVRVLTDGRECSVNELAECVEEPVSSTYRLLSSLLAAGWVAPGLKRGRYRLGLFFLRIGSQVEDRVDLRERTRPALQRLHQRTGQTAHLCVRDGLRAVCIERIDGGDVRWMGLRPGTSLPLVVGGAPVAILANLPVGEYESIRDSTLAQSGFGHSPGTVETVDALVAETRARGFAISDGDITPGVAALGTPVFDHSGQIVASISVGGLREHILDDGVRESTIAAILDCAREASLALGWPGESL